MKWSSFHSYLSFHDFYLNTYFNNSHENVKTDTRLQIPRLLLFYRFASAQLVYLTTNGSLRAQSHSIDQGGFEWMEMKERILC